MARKPRAAAAAAKGDRLRDNIVAPVKMDAKLGKNRGAGEGAALQTWSEILNRIKRDRLPRPRSNAADKPVLSLDALPVGLATQYHAQPGLLRRHIDYYEGDAAKRPAFRDRGGKLVAYQADPTTVASLTSIALHRNWQDLHVIGDRAFRRAVWLEATRSGIRVTGYRPSARDRDAATTLETADASPEKRPARPMKARGHAAQRAEFQPGLAFQQGVSGLLVEYGQAPYQNQPGGKPTPFLRVDIGAARPFEVWGVDLSKALQDAQINRGDAVRLSWHGPDFGDIHVEKAKIRDAVQAPSPSKDQRFREASPDQKSRDPALASAQAHLAVVEAVAREKLTRPKDRAQIGAAAKAKLAKHMARGSDFNLPRVAERVVQPAREPAPAPARAQERQR